VTILTYSFGQGKYAQWYIDRRSYLKCVKVYLMYNDRISYLVNEWWVFCKYDIVLKGLSNKNNPQ
jgi:hypothetical protein